MPKSPNIIQFSLPTEIREKLEAMGSGESVALIAKKVLLEALEVERSPGNSLDALAEIRDRLEALEENQGHLAPEDLARLEKMVEESLFPDLLSRLEKLEMAIGGMSGRSPSDSSEIDRLSEKIKALEQKLQAHISPPPREPTQGLTHAEMGKLFGLHSNTLYRMSKEPERWPEGYIWSDESKKWFQAED